MACNPELELLSLSESDCVLLSFSDEKFFQGSFIKYSLYLNKLDSSNSERLLFSIPPIRPSILERKYPTTWFSSSCFVLLSILDFRSSNEISSCIINWRSTGSLPSIGVKCPSEPNLLTSPKIFAVLSLLHCINLFAVNFSEVFARIDW